MKELHWRGVSGRLCVVQGSEQEEFEGLFGLAVYVVFALPF